MVRLELGKSSRQNKVPSAFLPKSIHCVCTHV